MLENLTAKQTLQQVLTSGFLIRFLQKVGKGSPDECWPWKAAKNTKGYGLILLVKKKRRSVLEYSHRAAWMIEYKKPIPKKTPFVLHSCIGNPGCCNPSHLKLGTNQDNMDDMRDQGRRSHKGAPGERNFKAKLRSGQVLEIRRLSELGIQREILATRFNVSSCTIWQISTYQTWRHVHG